MKRISVLKARVSATALALAIGLSGGVAVAQTLEEAMSAAYQNNPELNARRARLRATDENLPQALAGWRPSVSVSASVGRSHYEGDSYNPKSFSLTPKTAAISASQPLYSGGRTVAATARAKQQIEAERARVRQTEGDVLFSTAQAYLNVLRDQAVLELNSANQQVLTTQLQATRDKFRVGEVTRTDVSQAEARLEGVIADRIAAEGQLEISRATFEKVTGVKASKLTPPKAPVDLLPQTMAEALDLASKNNLSVIASRFDETAAKHSVDETFAELLPSVSLNGNLAVRDDTSLRTASVRSAEATVQMSVPLYEAGGTYSRTRQAKQTANQRRIDIETSRRSAVEQANQAYQSMTSARARIDSLRAQIKAAEVALDGVRQEAAVGTRTTLDVLNAEQELLNSQVSLVRSQRDLLVAAFSLLNATGRLTAEQVKLNGPYYDVMENYNDVKGRWLGTGIKGE